VCRDLKRDGRAHRFSGEPDATAIDPLLFDQPLNCRLDIAALVKAVGYVSAFTVAVPASIEQKHIQSGAPQDKRGSHNVGAILLDPMKHNNGSRLSTRAHPPAVQKCTVE